MFEKMKMEKSSSVIDNRMIKLKKSTNSFSTSSLLKNNNNNYNNRNVSGISNSGAVTNRQMSNVSNNGSMTNRQISNISNSGSGNALGTGSSVISMHKRTGSSSTSGSSSMIKASTIRPLSLSIKYK